MRIKRATFVTSLTGNQRFEGEGLPQIAIAGKSNVGKSSLINCLCNQNKLARVSAEPGKTRLVNIFRINDDFHLVDLPGYGYARVSRSMQEDWGQMMDSYLSGSEHLCHILHLVDIRHDPGQHDLQMQAWIQHNQLPCTVIATKCDKLSRAQQQKSILAICRALGVQPWDVLPFSSVTRAGREELLERLGKILGIAEDQP
ncbi:MAG: ribosome biogenesis GTP-binding protein YihA/YsxC [Candidatus Spyradocola sp.]|nr:ribosome biogenesis GTP-binding protein YihA/YsxC [Candidatus Spyradocola sp.]